MLTDAFKHLDLKEVAARVEPSVQKHSKNGLLYLETQPGKADFAFLLVVDAIAKLWREGSRPLRMQDIEDNMATAQNEDRMRVAASLKRLARIKQIKLDFDREGVIVSQGSAWIET